MVTSRALLPAQDATVADVSFDPPDTRGPKSRKRRHSQSPKAQRSAPARRRRTDVTPSSQITHDESTSSLLDSDLSAPNAHPQTIPHPTPESNPLNPTDVTSQHDASQISAPDESHLWPDSIDNQIQIPFTAGNGPHPQMQSAVLGYGILQVRIQSLPILDNIVR